MNASLMSLEIVVVLLGLILLLADLYVPLERKRRLGYVAALALFYFWAISFYMDASTPQYAFGTSYVLDDLALFFKRFFLVAAMLVLVIAAEFGDRIRTGIVEFYALMMFALAGMMFAASANSFAVMFASLELITVTFYVLTAFQRHQKTSLEAGVKYLIVGALSSAFLVFGIALVFGSSGCMGFEQLAAKIAVRGGPAMSPIFQFGMVLVLAGLGFKIAAVPFQIWVPDVYQGAPLPVTAFLAVGSKAAGFALLMRVFLHVIPIAALRWEGLVMFLAGATILFGNLCALPQRNLKRLLGYSSIAHAGYMLLGVSALSMAGASAVLYYLSGYVFTVLAAFAVICIVVRECGAEDLGSMAGLSRRSPLLAVAMTLSMVSLAGIPPLAGFFGKFLLFKALIQQGNLSTGYYWLTGVAIVGVLISIWYYFGVIKEIFWGTDPADLSPIQVSLPGRMGLLTCMIGMIYLGVLPELPLWLAEQGALALLAG